MANVGLRLINQGIPFKHVETSSRLVRLPVGNSSSSVDNNGQCRE